MTNINNIYAIGDVTVNYKLTPVAIKSGRIFAENEYNINKTHKLKLDNQNIPSVIFSHPPIGYVGLNYNDACKTFGKDNILIYKSEFYNLFENLQVDLNKREKS